MEKAIFFEEKNGKPTGFFQQQVISGSKVWKVLAGNKEITYFYVGRQNDLTPVFKRMKSAAEDLEEGLERLLQFIIQQ